MTQSKNKVILYIGLKMIGVMKMTALAKTIETLLENKKYSSLRDVLSSMNEADIAAMFSEVSSDSLPLLRPLCQ